MADSHWERVKELLHRALQLAPHERARFLDESCAGEDTVRKEVESLLSADRNLPEGFLDSPPLAPAAEDVASMALAADQIIAQRFRLVRKLGEGGMGQVWLAEQLAPVRRTVALKLIRAGMYDEAVVHRFRAERQSLAIMDHPTIAKVFDAGTTPQGQPYFVMEYVPGQPITTYCDERRLGINARIELLVQACEGVQHAHQKAIIHRDLKPANVLVVEVDGKPVPRIIDFGLAKASSADAAEPAALTRMGHFLGTPGFMSPEQFDPEVRDVDSRADVYALGAILYLLLTGSLPFEKRGPLRQPLHEFLRRIREDEPPMPSAKLAAERDTATAEAEARGTQVNQLIGTLRGDLDWITMKALERERTRRYATPSELAADLRRYLAHEPVTARPDATAYRLRKYLRRHRVGVAVAAGALLLLAAFSILQAIELRRTTQERDRANHERDRATRIADFVVNMFRVADPRGNRGSTTTVQEVLDRASAGAAAGLDKDPEVQADILFVMGHVYDNLGLYAKGAALLGTAHDLRLHALGPNNAKTIEAQTEVGWNLFRQHRYPEAEALLRRSVAEGRSALGPNDLITVAAMDDLGITLTEDKQLTEAESLQRQVVDIYTRTLGLQERETVKAMADLAAVFMHQKKVTQAESLYRRVLDLDRQNHAQEYPDVQIAENNLAQLLSDSGRNAEAEKLYRRSVEITQRVLGPEHPETLAAINDLANALSDEKQYTESEALNRQVLEIRRRLYGPNAPVTESSVYNLACLAALTGRKDEALSLLREAVEHGYPADPAEVESDDDLKSVNDDPRFKQIVADARQRTAASP
jgi:non-specific serine/threonine protein kinase/serine/threonine-protein kinase